MERGDEVGSAGRLGAQGGVIVDEDTQERVIADLRSKLTEDAMPTMVLFGLVGFLSLLTLVGFYRDFAATGVIWVVAVPVVLGLLIPIRIFVQLRTAPRRMVSTSYPIASRVVAGTDDGYLWHSAALGSARTILSVYGKLRLTADSVMLKHAAAPTTIVLPRKAFTEDDIRTLEAHFAPRSSS